MRFIVFLATALGAWPSYAARTAEDVLGQLVSHRRAIHPFDRPIILDLLKERGVPARAATLGEVVKLPPKSLDHVGPASNAQHRIHRYLAAEGLFIGMDESELRRFRIDPDGIEFKPISHVPGVDKHMALRLQNAGFFTSLLLYKATESKSILDLMFFNEPQTRQRAVELVERLQAEIRRERARSSVVRPLAELLSSDLSAFLASHQIVTIEDLSRQSEEKLLRLGGMRLRWAHELHQFVTQMALTLACEKTLAHQTF